MLYGPIILMAIAMTVMAETVSGVIYEIPMFVLHPAVILVQAMLGFVKISRYRRRRYHYNVSWSGKKSRRPYRLRDKIWKRR